MKRNYLILGMAMLALGGALLAQDRLASASTNEFADHGMSAAAVRGKEVFEKKCAICHFAESEQKKIGPGLKGLFKRGKFINGNKVTADSLKTWIENGDSLMPGMKETMEPAQIKDVVAYVKTL